MQQQQWAGVLPAITTPFDDEGALAVDHGALAAHVGWLIDRGCQGIVALGSLGEAATLGFEEKVAILTTISRTLKCAGRAPGVAGIAGLATAECVAVAQRAAAVGCDGLMVLPAYVYRGGARGTVAP